MNDDHWSYLLIALIGVLVGCELASLMIGPPPKPRALSPTVFTTPPPTRLVVADMGGRLLVEIAPNSDANHAYWDCAMMASSQGETHFGFAARGVWDKDRYRIDVTCAIGSQGKGSRFVMKEKALPLNAVAEWKP